MKALMSEDRKRTKGTRRADSVFGYLIPFFFVCLASYQEIHDHTIDKYVIGALMVFGLGALGWRIDVLFDKYLLAKASSASPSPAKEDRSDA